MGKNVLILFLLTSIFLSWGTSQASITLGFNNISANNVGDAVIGESQLFVDVTEDTGGAVLFTFRNVGTNQCYISDVYFDDYDLLGSFTLIDADDGIGGNIGVDFSPIDRNGNVNLPSANSADPDFVTTNLLAADNDPGSIYGVDPGESLGILFTLKNSLTFSKVLKDLAELDLRIGIHVQGFASGGSEAFVNTPYDSNGGGGGGGSPVPEPATLMLFGFGLLGLAGVVRKKSRQH